jgi:lipid-A-disaccharide synthase-like uncharacterized protein
MKLRLINPDEFKPHAMWNEAYYIACKWWHRRAVADYYHPPRRYRPWDMKVYFILYLIIGLVETLYYLAWKANPVGIVTSALGYLGNLALIAKLVHDRNLDKWRDETEDQ